MSDQLDQHLEMPEMARLLEATRVQPLGDSNSVHPHFAVCAICREQFEGLVQTESQVRGMQSSAAELPQGDCPSADVWGEVARGETEPDQALAWIGHASRCEYCGPRLRSAIGTLVETNAELTESDRKQIASLDSSGAEWQQRLAQRITGDPHSGRERPRWWEAYLAPVVSGPRLGVAMVAILMVAALVGWQVSGERKTAIAANRLLARAYTNQRTLELRIPEAEYAPLRVQRGPAASFVARPPALLKAEALIASQLAAHPDDPAWLQAAARANMLEGKYDAAVESLERALELQPRSPELLADLGTAHFQRGQSEDRQEDFGAAYENFSKVLVLQPENKVVLFNRAIVAEHQFLYRQALDDWEHYLKLDARSQWAEEARNRAEAVRAKLKEHESGAQPLLSPDKIASFANSGGADAAKLELDVDQRVEQYLDAAVRSWLALAYPEGGTAADLKAQQALFFLADLTVRKHNDRWLTDLLSGSSDPSFPPAVIALGKAFQGNRSGGYETARKQARIAQQLFSTAGNTAGVLRSRFELTLTDQLTRQNAECGREAVATSTKAEQLPYAWLQIQLQLEKAVCSLLEEEDWGADERLSRSAMERARQSNYQELYLRALFFAADDQVRNGDLRAGLKSVAAGLNSYWSGRIPHIRGYSLYNLVGTVPELVATEPHFVMAIWREGTALVDSDDDLLMRAWAHGFAARAATAAHEPQSAAAEFAQASELFTRAPRSDASRRFLFQNEILTAQLEAELGQYDSALERLTRIQNQIRIRPDKYFEELFYATLGELQLRSHNAVQAEQAFQPALELAEQRLESLNSEAERVKWSKEAAPLYLGMAEAELVQGHSERSLEFFEWYLDAPARSGQNRGVRALGAEPAPNWLATRLPLLTGQTVIAYGTLTDGLAVWEFDNRGVTARWFPQSNQDLQELVARFYDLASDPKSEVSALRRDSQTLYVALITPVEQRLDPGRALVIETNGWLMQVPFEALLDSTGHYLIERASIVHSLGQGMDASLHPSVLISSDLHAVVVGSAASSQTEGLIPLPDVAAEADAVARKFRSPAVFKGADATLRTVEKELPSAAVFHYTGHSMARTTGAALMLAAASSDKSGAAFLDGDRLRHLGLHNLQLAVLSTCNTQFGNDDGRGFNGIAEGLERAGVPHVVASRWPVDSAETRRYIENFYRHALSGELVSEALRESSRSMMADPRTSHPYYWSAFSAYGRP